MTLPYYNNVDGRRQSNPLKTLGSSPAQAPGWQLSRVVSAQDTTFVARSAGVNCQGYQTVRFAITPMTADPRTNPAAAPGGSATVAAEVRIWSDIAKAFVALPTPITHTAGGAGVAYVMEVPNANGAILGCFVTNALGGVCAIAAQGFAEDA
jgi:hypothetical protein